MLGFDNPSHIAIVVVVLLLVFGAKRLPEIGKSLGSGMREFKRSVTGESAADDVAPAAVGEAIAPATLAVGTPPAAIPPVSGTPAEPVETAAP